MKPVSEARADRVIPLVSQAVLQLRKNLEGLPGAKPLIVVVAKTLTPRLVDQLGSFISKYAPDVAIGMFDSCGLRRFAGEGLKGMNRNAQHQPSDRAEAKPVHLFSDLSQWLLKVLLAPDLADESLLHAPLMRYRNTSELARAGGVSVMTAFRFVEELRANGYLHESSNFIRLVRLDDLLERWKAAVVRPVVSVAANWLFKTDKETDIQRLSKTLGDDGCVAFYAAARALGFGIARGVPTHIYVKRLPSDLGRTLGLLEVAEGSPAQVILRVPSAKQAVFRGAVSIREVRSCDVLQTWLDVSHDPSRGSEEADHLYRRVMEPMLERAAQ